MAVIEIAKHKNFRLTGHDNIADSNKLADSITKSSEKLGINKTDFVLNALTNACKNDETLDANSLEFGQNKLKGYGDLSEQELVNLAIQDTNLMDLARKCLVTEAKKQWQSKRKLTRKGGERKRGTSDQVQDKLNALIKGQMVKNDEASNWYEKRAINTSWAQKNGKEDSMGRTTGVKNVFGYSAVKTYIEAHQQEIDAHHAKHEMRGNFNQKVSNELKRLAK